MTSALGVSIAPEDPDPIELARLAATTQSDPRYHIAYFGRHPELIAEEITRATGCAISPILGISVLGAYTYYTTPVQERKQVPDPVEPAQQALAER